MNFSGSISVVTRLWVVGPKNRLWIFSKSKRLFFSRKFPDLLLGLGLAFRVSGVSFFHGYNWCLWECIGMKFYTGREVKVTSLCRT